MSLTVKCLSTKGLPFQLLGLQISCECAGSTRGKSCGIGGDTQDGALVRVHDTQTEDNNGALVRVQYVDIRTAASVSSVESYSALLADVIFRTAGS
jgi:hypothetical protein